MFTLFIALLVVEFIVLIILSEMGNWGVALLSIVATCATIDLLLFKGSAAIAWTFISANPWTIIAYFAIWSVVGLFWSFYRWYVHLIRLKKRNHTGNYEKAIDNKDKIISWMVYWPFSVVSYLVSDIIMKFYTRIYETFSGVYDKIYVKVFGNVEK